MKQIKTIGYQLPYRTKEQLHELFGAKNIPPPETKETRDIEVALEHPMKQFSGKPKIVFTCRSWGKIFNVRTCYCILLFYLF